MYLSLNRQILPKLALYTSGIFLIILRAAGGPSQARPVEQNGLRVSAREALRLIVGAGRTARRAERANFLHELVPGDAAAGTLRLVARAVAAVHNLTLEAALLVRGEPFD